MDLESADAETGTRELTLTAYGDRWVDTDFGFIAASN